MISNLFVDGINIEDRSEVHPDQIEGHLSSKRNSIKTAFRNFFGMRNAQTGDHEISTDENKDEVENRIQLLQTSRLTLTIKESALKRQFKLQKQRKYRRYFNVSMLILAFIILLQTLITLVVRNPLDIQPYFIALRSVFSGCLLLLVAFSHVFEKREWLERILLFIIILYGSYLTIYQGSHSHSTQQWVYRIIFLELTFILVMGLTSRKFEFLDCLLFYVVLTPIWLAYFIINYDNLKYTYLFYYFALMLFILGKQYIVQRKEIKAFNLALKQNQRYFEQNSLVSQLLPTHVYPTSSYH